MKQNTTNTFNDGLNFDLHPIVTPNSVLTDNLNGTFITYNGNEFCLQNDRGNTLKATLSEGFIPIGIKEHNGILYIVSHNEKTGKSEIGTYPGIEWPNTKDEKDAILEKWFDFQDKYTPLKNFLNDLDQTSKTVFDAELNCLASPQPSGYFGNFNTWNISNFIEWAKVHDNIDDRIRSTIQLSFTDVYMLFTDTGLRLSNIDFPVSHVRSLLTAILNGSLGKSDIFGPAIIDFTIDEQNDIVKALPFGRALSGDDSIEDKSKWNSDYWPIFSSMIENNPDISSLVTKYEFTSDIFYKIFSYSGYTLHSESSDTSIWKTEELVQILKFLQTEAQSHSTVVIPEPKVEGGIKHVSEDEIDWSLTKPINFRTSLFGYSTKTPVDIEIQDSYDGSVNLILSDKNTKPRLINSGFSVSGDKYKINKGTDYLYYTSEYFNSQTSLIKQEPSFMSFDLQSVGTDGQLKGGNYTFYAYFGDSDGNMSDLAAESGVVSIFKGNPDHPYTVSGTLADERTDKSITFQIKDIPYGYSRIYLSYVREFSDTQGYLQTEAFKLAEPYKVNTESSTCTVTITGFENETSISVEDLNITYFAISNYKAASQQQDMLFVGNVNTSNVIDYDDLTEIAKLVKTKISNRYYNPIFTNTGTEEKPKLVFTGNYTQIKDTLDYVGPNYTKGEYYDPKNIYSKVGYWPGEYYRFGIVFIKQDGTNTPAFPICGGQLSWDSWLTSRNATNTDGVLKLPDATQATNIISQTGISPWHFTFDYSEVKNRIANSDLKDSISGFFIVRQKRIPEVILQGLQIPLDEQAHVPIMPKIKDLANDSNFFFESFVKQTSDLTLEYIPENTGGTIIRRTGTYTVFVPIRIGRFAPSFGTEAGRILAAIFTFGITANWKPMVEQTETVYLTLTYNSNKVLQEMHVSTTVDLSSHECRNTVEMWYYRGWKTPGYKPSYDGWTEVDTRTWDEQWNSIKSKLSDTDGSFYTLCWNYFKTDSANEEDSSESSLKDHMIPAIKSSSSSAILSQEAMLNPSVQNRLDGSDFEISTVTNVKFNSNSEANKVQTRHFSVDLISNMASWTIDEPNVNAVYVRENTKSKVVNDAVFSNVVGSAYSASDTMSIVDSAGSWGTGGQYQKYWVLRGNFTPYVGLTMGLGSFNGASVAEQYKYLRIVQLKKRNSGYENSVAVRANDKTPFYTVSNRISVDSKYDYLDVYRGDCYTTTQTIRINRNFIDPDYPYTEAVVNEKAWHDNYLKTEDGVTETKWDDISRTDLNTVALGQWITFKCLASSNLGLRSEDPFDTVAMNTLSTPKSFYPLSGSTITADKQEESKLLNAGYGIGVGRKRYQLLEDVPYINQEYATRVMFSNKNVQDEFVNGYRVFQGLSYQDYDKQYGPIVKLLPWGNNLFCVFEHGLSILPINEKALLQTTTEQTIHIYGHGVLPEQMSIISQDYGSRYSDSVLRTPIGVYGVDTDAKKIWRFSDKQGFETLSDMKIETYLNNNLAARYNIDIDTCDIRTHYNSFKGDVIFTWYTTNDNEETEICSICYNERQGLWTTRYDWVPLVSENSNGEFYSLQRGADSIIENDHYIDKVGIYSHSTIDRNEQKLTQARPTKWYGKQHPFEFEFVVSDPVGVMKIYENLQIISNNVQPEELQFEFIGDSYFFNKARIYHTVFESKFSDRRRWGNEVTRNLKLYLSDPSRREGENSIKVFNKPNIIMNHDENGYNPFRNASILNDRDNMPLFGQIVRTDNATEEYHLRIPQECRNIETWGRRLGNMHYKEGVWTTTIEPILYDARLNNPIITTLQNPVTKWNSARIRDKWCKIRIRYSGEDLAVITAIKTILNV